MKLVVEGMTCAHCARAINQAIQALDADARVDVDVAGGTVTVEGGVDPGLATAAVEAEGYRVLSVQAAPAACCGGCHA